MRKMTLTAATLVILTGCSSNGGFMGMGGDSGFLGFGGSKAGDRDSTATRGTRTYEGESAQTRGPRTYDGGSTGTPGDVTYAGTPYSESAIASRYRLMPLGERYWPPVYRNQAFPPQEMWTD